MYLGAAGAISKTAGTVAGGVAGSIIPGVGTLIGSSVGGVIGTLLGGKAHYSPWNFLYDDYPQHIYENEVTITNLKNAINQLSGAPPLPAPPMYSKTGGPQYQASMQAIVPQYVPGSEQQIANYDRRLNEPGGAYENTVKAQLSIIPQLQAQLQQYKGATVTIASVPSPGSATTAPLTGQLIPQGPLSVPGSNPLYLPSPVMTPSNVPAPTFAQPNISVSVPGASVLPTTQAGMVGDFGSYAPYVFGGLGLLMILAFGADRHDASKKRKR